MPRKKVKEVQEVKKDESDHIDPILFNRHPIISNLHPIISSRDPDDHSNDTLRIRKALDLVDLDSSCLIVIVQNVTKDVMLASVVHKEGINEECEDETEEKKNTHPSYRSSFCALFPNATMIGDTIEVFTLVVLADRYQLSEDSSHFEISDMCKVLRIVIPDINQESTLKRVPDCSIRYDQSTDKKRNDIGSRFIESHSDLHPRVQNLQLSYEHGCKGFRGKYQLLSRFEDRSKNEQILSSGEINIDVGDILDDLSLKSDAYALRVKKEVQHLRLMHQKREIVKAIQTQKEQESRIYGALFDCKEELKRQMGLLLEIDDSILKWEDENGVGEEEEGEESYSIRLANKILEM